MTTTKRAIKGGELGVNGEWYKGGKFIATTERPKRAGSNPKGAKKQEIEPHKWEVAPSANHRSLFRISVGVFARLLNNTTLEFACSDQTIAYYGIDVPQAHRIIAAYNNGERWVEVDPANRFQAMI